MKVPVQRPQGIVPCLTHSFTLQRQRGIGPALAPRLGNEKLRPALSFISLALRR